MFITVSIRHALVNFVLKPKQNLNFNKTLFNLSMRKLYISNMYYKIFILFHFVLNIK